MSEDLDGPRAEPRVAPLPTHDWPEELVEAVRAVKGQSFQPGMNTYGTLARHPTLLVPWLRMAAGATRLTRLTPRQKELLILRSAALAGGTYPWSAHLPTARDAGIGTEELDRLRQPELDTWSDEAEWALLRTCDELHASSHLSDSVWRALTDHYELDGALDAITIVGHWRMASIVLNTCATALDGASRPALLPGPRARYGQRATDPPVQPRVVPRPVEHWPADLVETSGRWPRVAAAPRKRSARVYTTLANHPRLCAAFGDFVSYLMHDAALEAWDRELVVLRCALLHSCHYIWGQHDRIGREMGLTPAEVTRVGSGVSTAAGWSERDASILNAVDEMATTLTLSTWSWNRLTTWLDDVKCIELATVVGFYGTASYLLNACRVVPERGVAALGASGQT